MIVFLLANNRGGVLDAVLALLLRAAAACFRVQPRDLRCASCLEHKDRPQLTVQLSCSRLAYLCVCTRALRSCCARALSRAKGVTHHVALFARVRPRVVPVVGQPSVGFLLVVAGARLRSAGRAGRVHGACALFCVSVWIPMARQHRSMCRVLSPLSLIHIPSPRDS